MHFDKRKNTSTPHIDRYWYNPSGKRFRSTAEINRFLDHMEDSKDEDAAHAFATGKKQGKKKTPTTKVRTKTSPRKRATSVEKAKPTKTKTAKTATVKKAKSKPKAKASPKKAAAKVDRSTSKVSPKKKASKTSPKKTATKISPKKKATKTSPKKKATKTSPKVGSPQDLSMTSAVQSVASGRATHIRRSRSSKGKALPVKRVSNAKYASVAKKESLSLKTLEAKGVKGSTTGKNTNIRKSTNGSQTPTTPSVAEPKGGRVATRVLRKTKKSAKASSAFPFGTPNASESK